MSRETDYTFVPTDTSDIEAALVAAYEEITGATVRPASPEKLFISWVASIIVLERVYINYVGNQNIPSRAVGDNLDALGELFFGVERPGAVAAVCTVRFYISAAQDSAVLIPAGTRVTDQNAELYWETTADVYIAAGDTYADVTVRCQTAGAAGNGWTAGQINTIVDVYDYYSGCASITESEGGGDAATDDEYYELMRAAMDAKSTAGAVGSYIYHAKAVSTDIADVVVNSPEPGEVRIYVLMSDGTPAGSDIKAAVYNACNADDVRPLTDKVEMDIDPEEVPYGIQVEYYMDEDSSTGAAEIEARVDEAIQKYIKWQSGKLGRDINPNVLLSYLMTTGIKRVDMETLMPIFTRLRDGRVEEGYALLDTVPQIAALDPDEVRVVNMGYDRDLDIDG